MFTIHEKEKLMVAMAAIIARDRMQRGLRLNYPEAVSVITSQVMEWAREGRCVEEIMQAGTTILNRQQVMDGIPEMIASVQVEATFPDGTKLVTIHSPIQ